MRKGYLISVHGLILCYDISSQRLLGLRCPAGRPVVHIEVVERQALFYISTANITSYLSFGRSVDLADHPQPSSKLQLIREKDPYLRFGCSQKFLSSNPDGSCDFKVWNEVFEKFLFVELGGSVDALLSSKWYSRSQHSFVGHPQIEAHFAVRIGAVRVGLDQLIYSFEDDEGLYLVYDNYCVDFLMRVMPLVYFTAFGKDDTFAALNMCMSSIDLFGSYHGHFLIVTDRSSDEAMQYVPENCRERTIIRNVLAFDTIDYVSARFQLSGFDGIASYQPIIYCDVDIICSGPLDPIMLKAIQGDSIYARSEGAVDLIHYGSTLMANDPFPRVQKSLGFNSGVLAFKNVHQVKSIFAITLASLQSHLAHGLTRHATDSFDQPVANYVFNKIASFDVDQLTPDVHPCLPSMDDEITSKGLIHFFGGVGASHKIERMRKVLDRLCRNFTSEV